MNPGVIETTGQVADSTVKALASTPLAIALLAVNVAFLAFSWFILKEVSAGSIERNKLQMDLIVRLVEDCRQTAPGKLGALEHLLPK